MDTSLSQGILYNFDMLEVRSGEILSLCGSFRGPWYRARLAFYPRAESRRLIEGRPYQKTTYETGYSILGCEKILDLPGEQHFLVHHSQITRLHKAARAFEGLGDTSFNELRLFMDILHRSCNLDIGQHGLAGSGALHSILPTSDFDWVIYHRDPTLVKACVISSKDFKHELTFEMKHAYRKYRIFTGLSQADLNLLFVDRWKYFRFRDLHISMNFVDPLMQADDFLGVPELGERATLEGTVVDAIGCYHVPRIIPLRCEGGYCTVLTWLFLYNGALADGDVVQVSGRKIILNGSEYLLVESPQDYIRKKIQ